MSWSTIKLVLEEEVGDLWLSEGTLIGYYLGIALPMGTDDWLHLLCLMGEWGFGLSVLQCVLFPSISFHFFFLISPCPSVGMGVSQYQCGYLANGWSQPTTESKVWLKKA